MAVLRWSVVIVDLEPVTGREQQGERRRCLVVSNEPYHRTGCATVCPISAARSQARYPNEVEIPVGEAGQTKDAVILCHQVRTISLERVRSRVLGVVADPAIRSAVRRALAHHLWLDRPADEDGAAA